MLTISLEKVCYIIDKAHEYDVKVAPVNTGSGSNPADDLDVDILADRADDPTETELQTFLEELNEDEQLDLVVLMWIGRGSYDVDEWDEARSQARTEATSPTPAYLMGTPLLPDHLENGLDALGLSCEHAFGNR